MEDWRICFWCQEQGKYVDDPKLESARLRKVSFSWIFHVSCRDGLSLSLGWADCQKYWWGCNCTYPFFHEFNSLISMHRVVSSPDPFLDKISWIDIISSEFFSFIHSINIRRVFLLSQIWIVKYSVKYSTADCISHHLWLVE